SEFGITLFTISFILVSLLIIINTVRYLNSIDSKRSKAEQALMEANNSLEEKIKARTSDLELRTSELQLSEEKFYKSFHMSPVGIVLTDLITGEFIEMNEQFAEIIGYNREEAEGMASFDLGIVSQEEREKITNSLKSKGRLKGIEISFKRK